MLDIQEGIRHCGGDEKDYRDILQFVYENCDARMQDLTEFLQKEDFKNYVIKVHSMKSTLANIGAGEASEYARALEMAGKEGRFDEIQSNHPEMLGIYQNVMDEAKKYLQLG